MNKEKTEKFHYNVDMILSLEMYFDWLVNHLNISGKENIKGYISNDLNWYYKLNISEDVRMKIDLLPLVFHVIEKYTFKNYSNYIEYKNICFYLKYNDCHFCIGDSGNNVYFAFIVNPNAKKHDFIDCNEIINNNFGGLTLNKIKLN